MAERARVRVLPIGFKIELPTSSTFIEVQSSIKEYDPTIFDDDEDLGIQTISVPVPTRGKWENKEGSQGNTLIGKAQIYVTLAAAEDWLYRG